MHTSHNVDVAKSRTPFARRSRVSFRNAPCSSFGGFSELPFLRYLARTEKLAGANPASREKPVAEEGPVPGERVQPHRILGDACTPFSKLPHHLILI